MRNFYLPIFLMICLVVQAGMTYAQFSVSTNTNIGQKYSLDSVAATATFVVDFNTAKDSSFWKYNDTTKVYTITVNKCQTQRGLQVNVYPDSVSTAAVINGDFECRDYGGNRNPARVKSVASLIEILEKFRIKNAGTADSVKNVPWKPSACLFDLNANGTEQAFGAYPGMYKRVEYGFQFNFTGYTVTDGDITFDIDTYDPGNTGKTAAYKLTVATGSATGIIGEVNDFYVTGSGKKSVKLAAAIGKSPSEFNNKKVYIFLKTYGTGTPVDKAKTDPVVIFDNFKVSYVLPSWVAPAAGVKGNAVLDNSASPVAGALNKEGLFAMNLKTAGRLGTLTITNDRVTHATKLFTFLETGAVKARDSKGAYSLDVPYTFTAGTESVKEKIEIAAPAGGKANDDLMLFLKAIPKSTTPVSDKLELNCGIRIWYNLYIKGADVIDLSGIDKTTALADTLADATEGAVILLKPGMTYTTGAFAFNKSVEIRSADLTSAALPKIDCASNFNIQAGSNIGTILFRNISFSGTFDDRYVFNPSLSDTIKVGEIKFESCRLSHLRGVARFRAPAKSVIRKFTMNDCVVDSIRDYAIVCTDTDNGIAVSDIIITNSTFSKCRNFLISRMQSNSVLIENCTISEVPSTGSNYMFRWRGTAGNADITNGLVIRNTIWGHAWDEANSGGYAARGHNGTISLAATTITIKNVYTTSQFAFGAGFELTGFPVGNYTGTAAQLWVDPYKYNFNFLDGNFAGIGTAGDPRWAAVTTEATGIELPDEIMLYPNPARNYAKLRFNLSGPGQVNVSVFSITGQKMGAGTKQFLSKGINEVEINTANLKQGLYIYFLETNSGTRSGKLYIVK